MKITVTFDRMATPKKLAKWLHLAKVKTLPIDVNVDQLIGTKKMLATKCSTDFNEKTKKEKEMSSEEYKVLENMESSAILQQKKKS